MKILIIEADFKKKPEETADILRCHHRIPVKWCLKNERWNSILMTCQYQIMVVLLIGRAAREFCFNQSEALPRSG